MLKPMQTLHGNLLMPLEIGRKAIIHCHGDFIVTSRVVEIRQETAEYACFETMRTVYCVMLAPVPAAAVLPSLAEVA